MVKYQNVLLFFVYLCYLAIPCLKALHMYQQNRYQNERYWCWVFDSIVRNAFTILVIFCSVALSYGLLLVPTSAYPLILLSMVLAIITYIMGKLETKKVYRKPLVYTSRIRRCLVALFFVYCLMFLLFISFKSWALWIVIAPFGMGIPWLFVGFVGWCMQPIEKMIASYYIRDAKLVLKKHSQLRRVGISGSYGKTSIKNFAYALCKTKYCTLMTPQSYNNKMGITLTIRRSLSMLHELFLCEMGADHVNEIGYLMDFVKPHIGIVCAIGPQHLSTFKSQENIIQEKMKMIERLDTNGVGILNIDNEYIREYSLNNTCKIITYGMHEKADYKILTIHFDEFGARFQVCYANEIYDFETQLLGEHTIVNITCAIALAHHLGIAFSQLQKAVKELPFVEHRLQLRKGKYTIIDDAYNANPIGANYALDVLGQMKHKRILVTPGFLDLGEQSEQAHIVFAQKMVQCCDYIILVGKVQSKVMADQLHLDGFLSDRLYIVNHIQEAFVILNELCDKEDVVLLENDLPDAFNH